MECRIQMDKGTWRISRKRNGGSKSERSSKKQEHRGVLHKNISVVMSEQKEQNFKWWTETTKGAITKAFFSKIEDRLQLRLNKTPQFTTKLTGLGKIKACFTQIKIIDETTCPFRKDYRTVQHIIFDCPLLKKEREKIKVVVTRTEISPLNCNKLSVQYQKNQRILREYKLEIKTEQKCSPDFLKCSYTR